MTVTAQCVCGKTFYFPDNWADKTVFCRFCGAEVELGAPDPDVILPGASERVIVSQPPETEIPDGFSDGQEDADAGQEQPVAMAMEDEPSPFVLESATDDSGTVSEKNGKVVFEAESSPMVLEPVEEETGTSETSATEDTGSVDLTLEPD